MSEHVRPDVRTSDFAPLFVDAPELRNPALRAIESLDVKRDALDRKVSKRDVWEILVQARWKFMQRPENPRFKELKRVARRADAALTAVLHYVDEDCSEPLVKAQTFLRQVCLDQKVENSPASGRRRGRVPMPYSTVARNDLESLGVGEEAAVDLLRGLGFPLRPPGAVVSARIRREVSRIK